MKHTLKGLSLLLIFTLLMAVSPLSLAYVEPRSKTLEESSTHDYGSLKIQIDRWLYEFKNHDLRFYLVDVLVDDPAQLRTAFAGDAYSKGDVEPTSDIAERNNAILAVNGDFYNYKDNIGLIIRNGVLYRDKATTRDLLLVYADGTFKGMPAGTHTTGSGESYIAEGVVQAFCFGPLLVNNGEITELPKKYIISTKDTIREPRTAIGQVSKNHYIVLIADGRRENWSDRGMTMQEMQKVFVELGCQVAYNLDGGGSTTLILDGEKINRSSGSHERNVSDIVCFTVGSEADAAPAQTAAP